MHSMQCQDFSCIHSHVSQSCNIFFKFDSNAMSMLANTHLPDAQHMQPCSTHTTLLNTCNRDQLTQPCSTHTPPWDSVRISL